MGRATDRHIRHRGRKNGVSVCRWSKKMCEVFLSWQKRNDVKRLRNILNRNPALPPLRMSIRHLGGKKNLAP